MGSGTSTAAAELPKVIRLNYLDGDAPSYTAILRDLATRGGKALVLSERARPYACPENDQKRSGSTRKKLRQGLDPTVRARLGGHCRAPGARRGTRRLRDISRHGGEELE